MCCRFHFNVKSYTLIDHLAKNKRACLRLKIESISSNGHESWFNFALVYFAFSSSIEESKYTTDAFITLYILFDPDHVVYVLFRYVVVIAAIQELFHALHSDYVVNVSLGQFRV